MDTIESPSCSSFQANAAFPANTAQLSNLTERNFAILLRPEAAAKLINISVSHLARLRSWGELTEGIHYVRHGDRTYRYLSDALYHWAKYRKQPTNQQLLHPIAAAELIAISPSHLARLRSCGELIEGVHYVRHGQRCYRYLSDALYHWGVNRKLNG